MGSSGHVANVSRPEILVVDDDAAVRRLLEVALHDLGFAVRLAASGQDAVEIYQRHQESIALALVDVQMPELDGPGTLAALKKINPQLHCCLMSGDGENYRAEELLSLGASHVLPKPFSSLVLLGKLLWEMVDSSRLP